MQETYTVTVTTEDGRCLIQEKITGDYLHLCSLLSRLQSQFMSQFADSLESKIGHGSGTGQSVSDS